MGEENLDSFYLFWYG